MHASNIYFVYIFLIRKLWQTVPDYIAFWPVKYLQDCYWFLTNAVKSSYYKVGKVVLRVNALGETSARITFALVGFWASVCCAYNQIYLDFLGWLEAITINTWGCDVWGSATMAMCWLHPLRSGLRPLCQQPGSLCWRPWAGSRAGTELCSVSLVQ